MDWDIDADLAILTSDTLSESMETVLEFTSDVLTIIVAVSMGLMFLSLVEDYTGQSII